MQLTVTLFGGLRQYLPAGSSFNKCNIEVDDGASLESLLARIPIPEDKPFLVIFNDEKVDRQDYADIAITSSDEIVLIPPIKGG